MLLKIGGGADLTGAPQVQPRRSPPRSLGMDIGFYIPWALHFLLTVNDVLVRDYREQVSEARCSRGPVLISVALGSYLLRLGADPDLGAGRPAQ